MNCTGWHFGVLGCYKGKALQQTSSSHYVESRTRTCLSTQQKISHIRKKEAINPDWLDLRHKKSIASRGLCNRWQSPGRIRKLTLSVTLQSFSQSNIFNPLAWNFMRKSKVMAMRESNQQKYAFPWRVLFWNSFIYMNPKLYPWVTHITDLYFLKLDPGKKRVPDNRYSAVSFFSVKVNFIPTF